MTINSILNIKYDLAKSQGIDIDIQVILPSTHSIDLFDLNTIFFNLLDNAIEAASNADTKHVSLTATYKAPYFLININNTYGTSKESSLLHGYGTKIVEDIVKKYNGHIITTKKENYNIEVLLKGDK